MKKVLITGIAGQDGSYLAEFLLNKKYEVYGLEPSILAEKFFRVANIKDKLHIYECDVINKEEITKIIKNILPDEIYHLAAIVDTHISSEAKFTILHDNFRGMHNVLSAAKEFSPNTRLFFAGSSVIFGRPMVSPQDENTPINPNSPYGISKAAGYFLTKLYRESYGMFACTGILYNHESSRRSPEFLPKKITQSTAKIKKGLLKELHLGDLGAIRDWGYAGDYVEAMWLMLQAENPDDYVIGTGKAHTVEDILEIAFNEVGLNWKDYVVSDSGFVRAREQNPFIANPRKINDILKWKAKTEFKDIIISMVRSDLKELS